LFIYIKSGNKYMWSTSFDSLNILLPCFSS
jgi:hypothetical protein